MLLIGAGLLTRTLMQLYAVDPGFDLANVLSLQAPDFTGAEPRQAAAVLAGRARSRQGPVDACRSAAMASAAPLAGVDADAAGDPVDGADRRRGRRGPDRRDAASSAAGYFETVGTRLMAGRAFQRTDIATAPPVVILSESMARYYFKDQSPIGRRLSWKLFNGNWSPTAEIVGVAADTHADGIDRDADASRCISPTRRRRAVSTLLVRTAGSTDRHRAARGRDDPQRSIRIARSITCRRSRRSATRRSRRSG